MKKIRLILFMALVAMTFASCSDVEDFEPQRTTSGLKLVAGMPGITDDTRTELGMENGKLVPMWSEYYNSLKNCYERDHVYAVFYGQKRFYRFNITSSLSLPAIKATFEEVIPDGMQSIVEDLKTVADTTQVYFIKSSIYESWGEFNTPNASFLNGFVQKQGNIPTDGDILTSKPISAGDIVNNGVGALNLSFKRINAIIRVNIIPEEGFDINTESPIQQILLDRFAFSGLVDGLDNFGGTGVLDLKNGTFKTRGTGFISAIPMYEGPIVKAGKDGYPAYMCCKPITLNGGEKIGLQLMSMSGVLYESIPLVIPEGGIELKAGTITTFNINLKRDDLMSNTIEVKQPGTLTEDKLERAIKYYSKHGFYSYIEICGDINAKDIQVIKDVFNKDVSEEYPMFGLDLSAANIISSDTYYFDRKENHISVKDKTISKDMFYNLDRLRILILPENTEHIEASAISENVNLVELRIGSSDQSESCKLNIDSDAIYLYSTNNFTPTLTFYNSKAKVGVIAEDFIHVNDYEANLKINCDWMEIDINGDYTMPDFKWKGCIWNSVSPIKNYQYD